MKIKDLKHDHSLTDLLKVVIFSILMLLPFLAVGTKALYVICNKNAKDSYSGTNQNNQENIIVDSVNNFDYSKTYYLSNSVLSNPLSNAISSGYIYFNSIEIINNNSTFTDAQLATIDRVYYYASNTTIYTNFRAGNTAYDMNSNVGFLFKVTIRSISGSTAQIDNINTIFANSTSIYYINYFTEQQLDNVFYYAMEEMTNSELFSWTKNTGIYTGVKAMTDNLQVTTDVIAVLITYWTLLTVIYVIIDIVLKGFTLLTHMFQKESN